MKKNYKILIFIAAFLIMIICLVSISNRSEIKSIRSEHQLLTIANSDDYSELNTFERIITMPFSLLLGDRYYSRRYYVEDGYDAFESPINTTIESSAPKEYSKTNIQVEGIDEADIIKTDGDYIYSISENNVIITNVKDPNNIFIESKIFTDSIIPEDLLLYNNYLVVISASSKYRYYYEQNTIVEVYDITNKSDVKKVKSFELYEGYYTSRCIDGNLYIFSTGYLRKENDKVIRKYIEDNDTKEIDLKDIKYLKNSKSSDQTLIAHLDLNKISNVEVQSYLINISNAYISKNNIYLVGSSYYERINIGSIFTFKGLIGFFSSVIDNTMYNNETKIFKFEIDKNNGVKYNSTTTLDGTIVNQYSLDEKDGHLRIALENSEGTRIAILNEKLNLIGETSKVAPSEKMYASRFMGNKAYLVTYRNTDPLFVVDLTNETNPKVIGELKIPGYSTYLHPYDETHLIGIGMDTEEVFERDSSGKVIGNWVKVRGMKMALFDVSDPNNPKELDNAFIGDERTSSAVLTNPKALLFYKEKNYLAMPVNNYKEDFSVRYSDDYQTSINNYTNYKNDYISEGYFVYKVDPENGFNLLRLVNHEKTTNDKYYYYYGNSKLLRGVFIGDYLYTVSEGYVKVSDVENSMEISIIKIKE